MFENVLQSMFFILKILLTYFKNNESFCPYSDKLSMREII